jgi:glycerol-1-phosphatase
MAAMVTIADTYDVALLDLDGVVYVGAHAVPHAAEALSACRRMGMRLAYVTNNAARPPRVVAEHLTSLGVAAAPEEVVTSAQAAARMLAEMLPPGATVLVVGGDGLVEALAEQNLVAVAEMAAQPAAVVQGFHPDVGWRLLAEGAYAVASGLPWVASNVDRTIPTPRGRAPGNGALVEVLRLTTGRSPVVAGKPEPPMHREAVLRSKARRPIVVGDRLDTDIEGAHRAGADSLLVLTGVTDASEVAVAPPEHRPSFVGEDLRALLAEPADVSLTAGRTRVNGWTATAAGGRVVLTETDGGQPTRLDALRAVCGLSWAGDEPLEGVADALARGGW